MELIKWRQKNYSKWLQSLTQGVFVELLHWQILGSNPGGQHYYHPALECTKVQFQVNASIKPWISLVNSSHTDSFKKITNHINKQVKKLAIGSTIPNETDGNTDIVQCNIVRNWTLKSKPTESKQNELQQMLNILSLSKFTKYASNFTAKIMHMATRTSLSGDIYSQVTADLVMHEPHVVDIVDFQPPTGGI